MTESSGFNRIVRKLAAAFGGQVGVFLLGFLTQIILARTLAPDGKGLFSLVILVITVIFTFVHGSLGAANSHFTGRNRNWESAIVGNSLLLAILVGGLCLVLVQLYADNLLSVLLPNVDANLVKYTALVLPALLLLEYSSTTVMGQDRIGRFSVIITLRELMLTVSLLVLVVVGDLTVRNALTVWVAAAGVVSLFAVYSAWSGSRFRIALSIRVWFSMVKFSAQAHLANLSTFLKMRADMLIMGYYLDISEVGYYSIAMAIVMALWYLPASIAQVLIPYISWRDNEAGDKLTPKLCRIAVFVNAVASLMIGAFGWLGIKIIFGAQFLPAYPVLLILLPGAVLFSLAKLLSGDLGGRGLPKYAMYISLFVMIVNIIMNLVLIPEWRMAGAALTASFTHALAGLLFLWAFRRESGIRAVEALLIRKEDIHVIKDALKRVMGRG